MMGMPVGRSEVYPEIGRRIRRARIARGMSQVQLAGMVDVTRTSIINVEHGRQRLSVQAIYDIAETLGVPPKSLLPDR